MRAYAASLRLWFEFLGQAGVGWADAGVEDVARFVAWLRAPAGNVIVLETGTGRRAAATVNRHLAGVFGFYDHHARAGVGVAGELVAWRRVSRGSYKPFLHHVTKGRPVPTRPVKLVVTRRVPRTLDAGQVAAILGACEHLRDRFLFALLAETGMRVGQALGLRHCDFVSRRREIRIVARPDNANGARAKLREAAVIPVSTPLVRLYSEYMHAEYGDRDSDYVFVNLFGGRVGQPLCYPAVHQLAARISARTGIAFTLHMLRHTHATELIRARRADRGRRPAAHAPVLDDHQPDLHPSRCRRRPGGPDPGRGVGRDRERKMSAWSGAAAASPCRPALASDQAGRPRRRVRRRPLERAAPRRSRPPRTAGGAVRCHHPGLAARPGEAVVPLPPGHRVRVRDHLVRGAGLVPVLGVPRRASPRRD